MSHSYFENRECEYYPCHGLDAVNCLFCFCPLYSIADCGGNPKYIKDLPVDLTLSGHAHGGQWRFFGKGIFAPGQGIFPKYTKGVYENRLIVSSGLGNQTVVPKINNPPEILKVNIKSKYQISID